MLVEPRRVLQIVVVHVLLVHGVGVRVVQLVQVAPRCRPASIGVDGLPVLHHQLRQFLPIGAVRVVHGFKPLHLAPARGAGGAAVGVGHIVHLCAPCVALLDGAVHIVRAVLVAHGRPAGAAHDVKAAPLQHGL